MRVKSVRLRGSKARVKARIQMSSVGFKARRGRRPQEARIYKSDARSGMPVLSY